MSLERYRQKRRFSRTPEPAGGRRSRSRRGRQFIVQKHAARRLHYDFRLELDGVLKSWAVPKGPSLDPYEKRLAVQVEDHPLEYGQFEGVIPEGEYGAGTVLLWDRGTWSLLDESQDAAQAYEEGKLKIRLDGEKLRGGWMLVRMRSKPGESSVNWLLIKERDEFARSLAEYDVLEERPESVSSGASISEVKRARKRAWSSTAGEIAVPPTGTETGKKARRKPRRRRIAVRGAEKAALPQFVDPQLATLVSKAPEGERCFHEIKLDGYRLLCRLDGGRAKLLTRSRQDWTHRFPELAAAVAEIPAREAWLDGEVVALQPSGASNFSLLQQALSAGETGKLVYYAFDLLHLDGYDLRRVPLEDRKRLLAELLDDGSGSRVRYLDHMEGSGPEFFRQCCQMGLEGIISKRRDRPYRSGRTSDWTKLKCIQREEFVIGGYTLPSTAQRKGLGALLVGYFSPEGDFVYAGRVGTGFSEHMLLDLRHKLDALTQTEMPFTRLARERIERGTRWVRPELVAQVEFGNWTPEGLLRHPSFQGLREDRAARSVVREPVAEQPAASHREKGRTMPSKTSRTESRSPRWQEIPLEQLEQLAHLQLTHPDRVLYPEQGLTKLGLATYYAEIADWILPHLVDRPVSLVRCPEGRHTTCFYQKHAVAGTPPQLGRVTVQEKQGKQEYLVIRDLAGLLATVQIGVLELHPWGARTDRLDRPDRMILDLDPDPELPWSRVIEAAHRVRGILDELGLVSFVKTTGGKGLHLVAPLQRRHTWDELKEFAQAIAQQLAGQEPSAYTAVSSKRARHGKIYIDYLRNAMGATAVAAYSTRARPGATVSTPLAWDELTPAIKPDHFRVDNISSRLASLERDPWEELTEVRQSITARMKRSLGLP